MSAIQMATINGAEAYRVDHMIGSISPGPVRRHPVREDLGDFRVSMVMAGGEVVARDGELDCALGAAEPRGLLTARSPWLRPQPKISWCAPTCPTAPWKYSPSS